MPATVAARLLERHPRTVRAWIASGELAGVVVGGRYYTSGAAVRALLDKTKPPPTSAGGGSE